MPIKASFLMKGSGADSIDRVPLGSINVKCYESRPRSLPVTEYEYAKENSLGFLSLFGKALKHAYNL